MDPIFTLPHIALHPFPTSLAHTDRTVLVVLKIFMAFGTENVLLVDYVLLILQLV
jgi:hypothetical protein